MKTLARTCTVTVTLTLVNIIVKFWSTINKTKTYLFNSHELWIKPKMLELNVYPPTNHNTFYLFRLDRCSLYLRVNILQSFQQFLLFSGTLFSTVCTQCSLHGYAILQVNLAILAWCTRACVASFTWTGRDWQPQSVIAECWQCEFD